MIAKLIDIIISGKIRDATNTGVSNGRRDVKKLLIIFFSCILLIGTVFSLLIYIF